MSSSLENDSYLEALHKAGLYQEGVGLTKHIPSSQADQLLVRQNNVIIELLVSLHVKLDKLSEKSSNRSDIDILTEQMSALKAIDPKRPVVNPMFGPKEYKFGYRTNKL